MSGNTKEYMLSFFGRLENTTLNGLYAEFQEVTDSYVYFSLLHYY